MTRPTGLPSADMSKKTLMTMAREGVFWAKSEEGKQRKKREKKKKKEVNNTNEKKFFPCNLIG